MVGRAITAWPDERYLLIENPRSNRGRFCSSVDRGTEFWNQFVQDSLLDWLGQSERHHGNYGCWFTRYVRTVVYVLAGKRDSLKYDLLTMKLNSCINAGHSCPKPNAAIIREFDHAFAHNCHALFRR
jgi:hypothetical protein